MPHIDSYKHALGVHCVSAALRNISHYHTGARWSEAMCFGLGSGLNFTYVREPGAPFFLVMGRGSYMENHFCDALGIHLEATHAEDADLAWQHLQRNIDDGRLMLIDTDMFYLPYMVQSLDLMDGVHFGGHKVLVTGYDAEQGQVFLADYAWRESRTVTIDQLKLARTSPACPARPRNASFRFHFPEQLPALGDAIRVALHTFVDQMRYPFMPFNGLPAIERFCRQVPRWNRTLDEPGLMLNASLTAFMMEKAGTGGGGFRNLYCRFLREAAEILQAPALAAAAAIYHRLAAAWREVAALLEEAASSPQRGMYAPGFAARKLLDEIETMETAGVASIETFLNHETSTYARAAQL